MKITDEMLYRHAAEARDIWLGLFPDDADIPAHAFSAEFNKEMDRLAALSYTRRKPAGWIQRIAAILAVVVIGTSSLVAVNAEAREAFIGWIKELTEHYLIYRYEGDPVPDVEPLVYRPTWIPDGYSEFFVDEADDIKLVAYTNEDGEMIKLSYVYNPDETDWFINTENTIKESITVNGHKAELLISTDSDTAGAIIWSDENNCAFMVSGFLEVEDLVKMAESIRPIDPNEPEIAPVESFADLHYEPTIIPEGYSRYLERDTGTFRTIVFKNEEGKLLKYHYIYDLYSVNAFVVADGSTHSIVDINGYKADVLLFDDFANSNCISWVDENECVHEVHAFLEEEELIELAKSVKIID